MNKARQIAHGFYITLREEVINENPYLKSDEQSRLQAHYPIMLNPKRYPLEFAASIYASRRAHPVKAILENEKPVVFDAGCGFGSESFLFASLGAKVLAVDLAPDQISIARKRQWYYEEMFGKTLDITFLVADLNEYTPDMSDLSLTWLASVLAAIQKQDSFLGRVHGATRRGGKVVITDMNLLNPVFLVGEWCRRRRAKRASSEFSRNADFWGMFWRKHRVGARFCLGNHGEVFDDVQFFSVLTLSRLLAKTGFCPMPASFAGVVPPCFPRSTLLFLEDNLSKFPVARSLAYFYLATGIKE